jgi:hypothetical protein
MEDKTSEFERVASANEQERQHIIQQLVRQPDEALEIATAILKGPEKRFWETAVQVIQAIGYPRNASTMSVLFEQLRCLTERR